MIWQYVIHCILLSSMVYANILGTKCGRPMSVLINMHVICLCLKIGQNVTLGKVEIIEVGLYNDNRPFSHVLLPCDS